MPERPAAAAIVGGQKRAIAQALNLIEDRRSAAQADIASLLAELRDARGAGIGHRVGLTGPPGVGKSTLTSALARELRARGRTVGVVAVDPSSVRSGGALLGDRARMSFDPADAGLFVRSLATAGEAGGLAYAAPASVEVLAAAYEVVLVETTGVGQTETDVEYVVDTVTLVIQPGSGDVLQFIKAGIMEIPDVLVVNKGDHGRLAEQAAADLTGALDSLRGVGMADAGEGWRVPVCITSARDRVGIDRLADLLDAHRTGLGEQGLRTRRGRGAVAWGLDLFRRQHGDHGVGALGGHAALRGALQALVERGADPVTAARTLSERYLSKLRRDGD